MAQYRHLCGPVEDTRAGVQGCLSRRRLVTATLEFAEPFDFRVPHFVSITVLTFHRYLHTNVTFEI